MHAHDSPRRKSKAMGTGFELYICAFDKPSVGSKVCRNDGRLKDIIKY